MAQYDIDMNSFDNVLDAMKRYEGNAANVVNEYLWGEGGQLIEQSIMPLLPVSGRTWRGKPAAASSTNPFMIDTGEQLAVTVKSTPTYDYLYFPDDGSNTQHHQGGQEFMLRGGEAASDEIVNELIQRLVNEME